MLVYLATPHAVRFWFQTNHYNDVIMTRMASQITSLMVVYSTVYSDADQRKHQSPASLAFVWGIHRDRWIPRTKGQLRGKCFHLMTSSCGVFSPVSYKYSAHHRTGRVTVEHNLPVFLTMSPESFTKSFIINHYLILITSFIVRPWSYLLISWWVSARKT